MVTRAFPHPGRLVELAYTDLLTAAYGDDDERRTLDRMHFRLQDSCIAGHQDWPAAPRHRAYHTPDNQQARQRWFSADLAVPASRSADPARPGHLILVDTQTGEVHPPQEPNGGR